MWQVFLLMCIAAGIAIAREHFPNPCVPIVLLIIMVISFLISIFGGDKIFALICAVSTLIFITVALTYAGIAASRSPIKSNSQKISNRNNLPTIPNFTSPSVSPISTFSTSRPISPQTNINTFNPLSFQFSLFNDFIAELCHGTPSIENALDIISGRGTFIVGSGNQYGTGVYFADFNTAKTYAGTSGAIIKVSISVPYSQIADYSELTSSVSFTQFGKNIGDGITNYVLNVLRKRFLKVNNNLIVALSDRTNLDERVVFEGVTINGILDNNGNQILP